MISSLILLLGMVGVLQGLAVSSIQNSMANRQTRATMIAHELISAIEQQGRARLLTSGTGLFDASRCLATVPTAISGYAGELSPTPPALTAQGFTTASTCYIDFDALPAAYRVMTPGYSTLDDTGVGGTGGYTRLIAVYQHPTNPEVLYVGVNVGWRDAGRIRTVKRFTALYDTTTNQTNLEF